jgi:4-amino-4-deoxy-L-arabinose transferase-like glycosyltransferase
MRVLIDGNVHDPLSPAEEQDVRQFRAEESVQGSVLSADEATKARVSQTKRVLAIFWGLIAVAAAGIASLAEPADLPVVLTAAVVAVGALGAFFAFMVWRRMRSWRLDLPRRLVGMAPANTVIGVTAAGVAVAGQIFPWSTLAIEQVELAKLSSRYRTMFTLERLTLMGPGGIVVLDPAMMRNGHRIVGNAWRRMRLAGSGVTV